MAHLSLSLLGEFQATLAGQAVTGFRSDKVRALLAYLAVESSQAHTRAQLSGLLWPAWPESAARTYLRQALFDLRRLLGDSAAPTPFLLVTYRTIQFNRQSDYSLDATALIEASDLASKATSSPARARLEELQQVAAHSTGNFMEGFFLDGCSAYEEWQLLTRERLRRHFAQLLRALIDSFEQIGDHQQALQYAWLQVELEPLLHQAHGHVLRLLALTGESDAALAHYRRYCHMLEEELGTAPTPEITTLIDQIRVGQAPFLVQPVAGSTRSPRSKEIPRIPLPASISAVAPPISRLPFVARERELAELTAHLESALNAQGRVILICGSAGQGKTALVQEFARQAQANRSALVVAAGSCDAQTGIGDPFQPFRDILGLLSGDVETAWRAGTITRSQAASLWHLFPSAVTAMMSAGPDLIGSLVNGAALFARVVDSGLSAYIDQEQLREQAARAAVATRLKQAALFEQTTNVLRILADESPLLLFLEDLHWADLGSLNLLFHLGRHLVGTRILIVGTFRPEEVALGRQGEPHPLAHVLNEFQQMFGRTTVDLRQSDGLDFVNRLLDTQPNRLGAAFRESLYAQSQGHALFTVELVRAMQERGDLVIDQTGHWCESARLDWDLFPARVEAAIAQRIERLPAQMRHLLSIASVEGERFTTSVLAEVAGLEEQEVIHWLSAELDRKHQLVLAHGTRRVHGLRQSQYRFRHILFQRYLYIALDDVERIYLHERVGSTLEEMAAGHEEELDANALRLARHFHQAEIYRQAVIYYHRAGVAAARMVATEEAIAHFEIALSLLKHVMNVSVRAQLELMLQIESAKVLGLRYGEGNSMLVPIHKRVIALSEEVDDASGGFQALHGLWLHDWLQADLKCAKQYAERILVEAQRSRDHEALADAYSALGHICFTSGDLIGSREQFERAVAQSTLARRGRDPGELDGGISASSSQFLAHTLWLLGFPDQAQLAIAALLSQLGDGIHPYDQAHALIGVMALHQYRQEPEKTREAAQAVLAVSNKYGFTQWTSWAEFMHGWATAKLGGGGQALDQMERAAAEWPGLVWGARSSSNHGRCPLASGTDSEGAGTVG